ncbi:MAG: class I SAM-dependent methyltransferase [Actinomycetales bacterium]|nr:class I SAM-dependent methyltransferase [Actinomycetales bacterium]
MSAAPKWLVGDRLSTILHIGDGPLAYSLSEQGHDVTIVGDDVTQVRNEEVAYVKAHPESLPFTSNSFEAVIAPHLDASPSVLAQYARVLVPHGYLSAMSRRYDDALPWVRKLRAITGDTSTAEPPAKVFLASGLFADVETQEFNEWQNLDLPTLMQFAEQTRAPEVPIDRLASVHQLWQEYSQASGSLRLRHETTCARARVIKSALASEPDPPDAILLSLE